MKITITVLIMLSVIFSKGQDKKDSLPLDITLARGFYGFPGERLPDVDTLKVVFLVGNINRHQEMGLDCFGDTCHTVYDTAFLPYIWQIRGYVARKKQSDQFNEAFWMSPVLNMDENKKPLRKTLIIWDVKEEPKP